MFFLKILLRVSTFPPLFFSKLWTQYWEKVVKLFSRWIFHIKLVFSNFIVETKIMAQNIAQRPSFLTNRSAVENIKILNNFIIVVISAPNTPNSKRINIIVQDDGYGLKV